MACGEPQDRFGKLKKDEPFTPYIKAGARVVVDTNGDVRVSYEYGEDYIGNIKDAGFNLSEWVEMDEPQRRVITKECGIKYSYDNKYIAPADIIPVNAFNVKLRYDVEE